jgi:hypothetical protein
VGPMCKRHNKRKWAARGENQKWAGQGRISKWGWAKARNSAREAFLFFFFFYFEFQILSSNPCGEFGLRSNMAVEYSSMG